MSQDALDADQESRPASSRRLAVAALAVASLLAGCSDDGAATATTTSSTTAATSPAPGSGSSSPDTTGRDGAGSAGPVPLDQVDLALEPAGTFEVPTVFRAHPDGSGWIGEKAGRVRSFDTGDLVLDISDHVRDNGEQGFLGMAFDPDGSHLYISYSDADDDGAGVVDEYAFDGGPVDTSTRREIIRVAQPFANHNGGDIHFGPDGYLWFGLGDGGSGGDPRENAQDTATLLGSILRIDPSQPSDGRAYGIPDDNPFAGGGGRPEIWLYGVRNPWRYTFDPATGDLWIADVGQNEWEEVDVLRADAGRGRGANLGWNQLEGTHTYDGPAPDGDVLPVYEYSHEDGCSITGGPVYRGAQIPELDGAYLFGDFCRPTVRAIRVDDTDTVEARTFDVDAGPVISFGVEASGEVLVLSQEGTVYRIVRG